MREFLRESIFEDFNTGLMAVTKGDFVTTPVTASKLSRNDELDLILELTSRGWSREKPERYPAGTVRAVEDVIEFQHPGGWIGTARGVVERGVQSRSKRDGDSETIETYSAHSVELDFQRQVQPSHVIEWVSNVPEGFIWSEPVRFQIVETATKSVGTGDAEIQMTSTFESNGGNQALYLRISGIDLYVMHSVDGDEREKSAGQIVYRTCPDQAFRDKVRTCLSFVLGKPIVYLGCTEYCSEWQPIFMKSVDEFALDGAVFKLNDLPPYPINGKYANMIDRTLVNGIINALFEKFDAIKFNEISWSYWYAVCAPLHLKAIHFGSLIEQLQNNSNAIIKSARGKLLDDEAWNSLRGTILDWLKGESVPPDIQPILRGKVASLNQAPQNLVLKRLLDTMGLTISEAEMKAWKHRNMAAHGGFSNKPVELILNSRILQLLFHRMLAGVTYCSDRYIDYYNLGHPVRTLSEAVPGR
jgi:hypothetical protein